MGGLLTLSSFVEPAAIRVTPFDCTVSRRLTLPGGLSGLPPLDHLFVVERISRRLLRPRCPRARVPSVKFSLPAPAGTFEDSPSDQSFSSLMPVVPSPGSLRPDSPYEAQSLDFFFFFFFLSRSKSQASTAHVRSLFMRFPSPLKDPQLPPSSFYLSRGSFRTNCSILCGHSKRVA